LRLLRDPDPQPLRQRATDVHRQYGRHAGHAEGQHRGDRRSEGQGDDEEHRGDRDHLEPRDRRQDDAALLDPRRHRPGHPDHRVLRAEVLGHQPFGRRHLVGQADVRRGEQQRDDGRAVLPRSRYQAQGVDHRYGGQHRLDVRQRAVADGLRPQHRFGLQVCGEALRVALHDRHPAQQGEAEPVERAQFALHRGIVRRHQFTEVVAAARDGR
jgi:hypothetical protein